VNALVWLVLFRAKNSLVELVRRPGKLIVVAILAAFAVFGIVLTIVAPRQDLVVEPVWVKAYLLAMLLMGFFVAITGTLKGTNQLYSLADVTLVFPSPIGRRRVLVYGLWSRLVSALLVGVFLLVFSPYLGVLMGVSTGRAVVIALGMMAGSVMVVGIPALACLSFTAGHPRRRAAVRLVALATIVPLVVDGGYRIATGEDVLGALRGWVNSPITDWTPLAGWAVAATMGFASGAASAWAPAGGLVLVTGALVLYLARSQSEFYEEALVGPETRFQRLRAVAEGQVDAAMPTSERVSVVRTGLRGSGAQVLFAKHLREAFRAHRLGMWGTGSVMMAVAGIGVAVVGRLTDSGDGLVWVLGALMVIETMVIGSGPFAKDMYSPYIYLIPRSPVSKMAWAGLQPVLKAAVEGLVPLVVAAVIWSSPPAAALAAVGAYLGYLVLLIAVTYLSMRWAGVDLGALLQMVVSLGSIIIIMAPGVVAAVVLNLLVTTPVALVALMGWELLSAAGCFALARGILHNCDMPVVKIVGENLG
jgi:hypothetical protein